MVSSCLSPLFFYSSLESVLKILTVYCEIQLCVIADTYNHQKVQAEETKGLCGIKDNICYITLWESFADTYQPQQLAAER